MLDSVKEILTKEIDLNEILEKEIDTKHIKDFLAQEIEIKRLKELLATEIKLKEFLVQEIDIKTMFSSSEKEQQKKQVENKKGAKTESDDISKTETPRKKKVAVKLPPYDFSLLDSLSDEQEEILFVHSEIMKFAKAGRYSSVAGRLDYFSTMVKAHFNRADKELYSYLRLFIQQRYPKREKAFTELSLEMKNISIEVFFTLTQSPNIPVNDKTVGQFLKEFDRVGTLLDMRIHREETVLFVMYEESNEAVSIS